MRGETNVRQNRVEVRRDPEVHLGTTVVHAVSDALGIPAADLDVELNDYVDPDALDALFGKRYDGTPRKGGYLTFSMRGCVVQVFGDGRVRVETEPSTDAQSN